MSRSAPALAGPAAARTTDDARPPAPVPWPAVVGFVVLVLAGAWAVCLPLWLDPRGLRAPAAVVVLSAMMLVPGLSALLVLLLLGRRRPAHLGRFLGLWPLRPAGRVVGMSGVALVGMPMIVAAGLALTWATGLVRLDLTGFSGYRAMLAQAGAAALPVPVVVLVLVQLLAIPMGGLLNTVFAFGEELGWRGFLLPALRPLGTWPALLLSGAIWGVWHSPVILLGYDFGLPNLWGVLLMTVACTLLGVLLGWLRLRTASVWPPAVAHGALNAAAGLVVLFSDAAHPPRLPLAGALGAGTWVVLLAVIVALAWAGQFRIQPELAGPRAAAAPQEA